MQNKLQHYKDVMDYLKRIEEFKKNTNIEIKRVIVDEEDQKIYVKKEAKNGKM